MTMLPIKYSCDRCDEVFEEPNLSQQTTLEEMDDQELYYRLFKAGSKDLCQKCITAAIEWMDASKVSTDTPKEPIDK